MNIEGTPHPLQPVVRIGQHWDVPHYSSPLKVLSFNGSGHVELVSDDGREHALLRPEKLFESSSLLHPMGGGALEHAVEKTASARKHSHYFHDVSHLQTIDIYRILRLLGITDPALQHAFKKVAAAGKRGAKDEEKDVREAIDSLTRFLQMRAEDDNAAV